MTPKKKATIKAATQISLITFECVGFPIIGSILYKMVDDFFPILAKGLLIVIATCIWIVIDNRKEEP